MLSFMFNPQLISDLKRTDKCVFYIPELYDLNIGDKDSNLSLDYYLNIVDTHMFNQVLELGAGTGKISLALAMVNIIVFCYDTSESMLLKLQEKAKILNLCSKIKCVNNIIQLNSLLLNSCFCCIANDDFFLHITSQSSLLDLFIKLRTLLPPKSHLFTDIRNRDYLQYSKNFNTDWQQSDILNFEHDNLTLKVSTKASFSNCDHIICTSYKYEFQYKSQTDCIIKELTQRLFINSELIDIAEKAGFRLVTLNKRLLNEPGDINQIGGSFHFIST